MCCPRYILRYATNTRSAREQPIKLGESPSQPSDPPRRIVSRWATCCPRCYPRYILAFRIFIFLAFCMAKTLGQLVSSQANRAVLSLSKQVILCTAVKQNCIEVGVLLPSIHPPLRSRHSVSAWVTKPTEWIESQPSGRRRRLYRGWHIVHIIINYYLQVT